MSFLDEELYAPRQSEAPASLDRGDLSRVIFLSSLPELDELSAADVAMVAHHTKERRFARGQVIQAPDAVPDVIQVIERGSAWAWRGQRDQAVLLGPRSVIGLLGALAEEPTGLCVEAAEHAVTVTLDVPDLVALFEDHYVLLQHTFLRLTRELFTQQLVVTPGWEGTGCERPHPSRPLNLVERMFFLRSALPSLPGAISAVADVARLAHEVRYRAGETLWHEGDPASFMTTIVWGAILGTTQDDRSFRFGPPSAVGAVESALAERRWFTARAETDVVGLQLDRRDLFDVYELHSQLLIRVVRFQAALALRLEQGRPLDAGGLDLIVLEGRHPSRPG
jgi:CRP-like cAMP-binding protein